MSRQHFLAYRMIGVDVSGLRRPCQARGVLDEDVDIGCNECFVAAGIVAPRAPTVSGETLEASGHSDFRDPGTITIIRQSLKFSRSG